MKLVVFKNQVLVQARTGGVHQAQFDTFARNDADFGIEANFDAAGIIKTRVCNKTQACSKTELVGELVARQYQVDLFAFAVIVVDYHPGRGLYGKRDHHYAHDDG